MGKPISRSYLQNFRNTMEVRGNPVKSMEIFGNPKKYKILASGLPPF